MKKLSVQNFSFHELNINMIHTQRLHIVIIFSTPFSLKKVLSKFRCSDHDLHIERGRHKGLPLEERLCTMCPNNSIENEAHFLTECPAYHELRILLLELANIKSLFTNLQFIQLMRNKSEPVIYPLAKFLKDALKIRNEKIA